MTQEQFLAFDNFRRAFRAKIDEWTQYLEQENLLEPLKNLQRQTADFAHVPHYEIENPLVYNRALDDVTMADEIYAIVIGDNPGKDEQRRCNERYLVGQAGKIAESFFAKQKSFGIDFRKNVIILNKTPIHTAKTAHLKKLASCKALYDLFEETQKWMVEKTLELFEALANEGKCELWLVGYSELKEKGVFASYRQNLINAVKQSAFCAELVSRIKVYQHFSMNRFAIDLHDFCAQNCNRADFSSIKDFASALGNKHRQEILGI